MAIAATVYGIMGLALSSCGLENGLDNPQVEVGEATSEAILEDTNTAVEQRLSKLPLAFEENEGQTDSQVRFLSRSKFNNTGTTLTSSAYIGGGGSGSENIGVAIIRKTDALSFVVGTTTSSSFPTSASAFDTTQSSKEGFVAKISF